MSEGNHSQANIPNMSMKAHKFLIYCLLPLWTACEVTDVGDHILMLLGEYSWRQPWRLLMNTSPLWLSYASICLYVMLSLIVLVFLIRAQSGLWKFKACGPRLLNRTLLLALCKNLIYMVFTLATHSLENKFVMPIIILVILVMMFCCRRYYNVRDQYFVN